MTKMDNEIEKFKRVLMGGVYEIVILAVLARRKNPSYGYMIIKMIEEYSGGRIKLTPGTIYPILKKLEKRGFIRSFWGESDRGPPRKYYVITKDGEVYLAKIISVVREVLATLGMLGVI